MPLLLTVSVTYIYNRIYSQSTANLPTSLRLDILRVIVQGNAGDNDNY